MVATDSRTRSAVDGLIAKVDLERSWGFSLFLLEEVVLGSGGSRARSPPIFEQFG
jgi:hypothetical protein